MVKGCTVDADRQMRLKGMNQKRGKNTGLNILVVLIVFMIFQACDLCLRVQNSAVFVLYKPQKFQTLVPAKNNHLKVARC